MANTLLTTESVIDSVAAYHQQKRNYQHPPQTDNNQQPSPHHQAPAPKTEEGVRAMCASVPLCPASLLPTESELLKYTVPCCEIKHSHQSGEISRPQLWGVVLGENVPVGDGRYFVLIDPLPGSDGGCALLADVEVVSRNKGQRVLLVDLDKNKPAQAMGCCKRPEEGSGLRDQVTFLRSLDDDFTRELTDQETVEGMVTTCWRDCPTVFGSEGHGEGRAVVLEKGGTDPEGQHRLFETFEGPIPDDDQKELQQEHHTLQNLALLGNKTDLDQEDVPDSGTIAQLLDIFAPMTGTFAHFQKAKSALRAKVVASMCQFGRLEEFSGTYRHKTYLDFQHFRFLLDVLGVEEEVLKKHAASDCVHDHLLFRPITAQLPSADGDEKSCGVRRLIKLYFKDRKTRKSGTRNHYFSVLVLHMVALCKEMHKSRKARARSVAYILTSCTWAKDQNFRKLCRDLVQKMMKPGEQKKVENPAQWK